MLGVGVCCASAPTVNAKKHAHRTMLRARIVVTANPELSRLIICSLRDRAVRLSTRYLPLCFRMNRSVNISISSRVYYRCAGAYKGCARRAGEMFERRG